ncbi:Receptor expression-enhancing protein 4 [Cercospora beticola]|uniref:Protein YOP1 n=1 Tax=Cercospora beticola TaxID=122368 RepID=A0A2G5I0C8_CERBT|nr:Receptor expression-enhancing protein 4 [Cercospora beticola]PIA98228.1 Receptor expression-enhancing protein 4 [Cercospora beticola]WPA98781.1 hypothetical protein RHO25_003394 [Cercospora beticola]CAK1360061.1 unnamed protein product [Cercospora beticola]
MFGFIADILTSLFSIALPIFFSYKALRTSDPGVLSPWLMYWTTLSIFLLVENQFYFILYWVPFYSWLRLGLHLYLVAPGQQGCVWIYQTYIHPFLEEHERQIDRMISDGHEKARSAGLDAVKRVIEYIRVQFLGQEPKRPTPPVSRNVSYTTQLFNRFALPSARAGPSGSGTSELLGLLGSALQQAYGDSTSQGGQARDLTASGNLIPTHLAGAEREDYVREQRERLSTLLRAFDAEADGMPGAWASGSRTASGAPRTPTGRKPYLSPGDDAMHRSRSESEFEEIGYEAMPDPDHFRARPEGAPHDRPAKGTPGWSNWIWGNYGEKDSVPAHDKPE